MSRYVQLFKFGQWRFGLWCSRIHWAWRAERWDAWRGKLVYRSWLCFELLRDTRTDILGDMALGGPKSKERA